MLNRRHYASIAEVLDVLRADACPITELLPGRDFMWTAAGAKGMLMPSLVSPFRSAYLYRGQSERFPHCIPSIFRSLPCIGNLWAHSPAHHGAVMTARMQLSEFWCALDDHPALPFSDEVGLRVFPEGLGQHYGIPTDHLDLTEDPAVAAFFATNVCDSDGRWSPMVSGAGVLYRAERASLMEVCRRDFGRHALHPIGKQALPRPGEQRAWTMQMPVGCDFETLPVDVMTFDHSESEGGALHARFNGGRALFPPDVLAEVARAIVDAPSLARCLWDGGIEGMRHSARPVIDRLPIRLTAEQMSRARAAVVEMRGSFLRDVEVRAVRGPMQLAGADRAAA